LLIALLALVAVISVLAGLLTYRVFCETSTCSIINCARWR